MGREKSRVNKALTRAHLHAIGLVAAHWNSLELMVLYILSELASTPFRTTVALAAPSNFAAWLDMLRRLANRSDEHRWKAGNLRKVCEKLKTLQTARNTVVHAFWHEPDSPGLGFATPRATGIGFPKRGLMVMLPIEKSAQEMRDIAKSIAKAERELIAWWGLLPPKSVLSTLSQIFPAARNLPPKTAKRQSRP